MTFQLIGMSDARTTVTLVTVTSDGYSSPTSIVRDLLGCQRIATELPVKWESFTGYRIGLTNGLGPTRAGLWSVKCRDCDHTVR